ncbi:MAG: exosortase K [Gammaproteobacteria bacterium RIFOXYA12_FULL_61_12]|nr:MAG: exosortase K [Gammaproteobacteria bacterium RIFOXYD12_FULL_61_37]OGT94178.1 MAG: exosortase K [Gammaproteobacteria bacterium RIFOXYA12_FULL_61_12]
MPAAEQGPSLATQARAERACPRRWGEWGLIALLALALKQLYGMADATELQWLLWPLARLLEVVSDLRFQPLPTGDWLDAGQGILIVKACAGGNFLLISWLAWLWRGRALPLRPARLLGAFAAAWAATLAANALRILLILHAEDGLARLGGLSQGDSHRLIGIAVYFLCLWIQLAGSASARVPLAVAAAALYLGVTLLLPALRAWALGLAPLDTIHVLWTAAVPLAVALVSGLWRAYRPGDHPSS